MCCAAHIIFRNIIMADIMPPHNIEAESSLLCAILIDQNAIAKIADVVNPDDFYKDAHRLIFEAMQELYARHEPTDLLTVGNRLEEKKQLEMLGGRSYMAELSNTVATAAHIVQHAKIIQKKATLRRLLAAAGSITRLGHEEAEDLEKLLDTAEQELFLVSQRYLKKAFVPIAQILNEAFDRIDDLHKEKGKIRGLPSGFTDLDQKLAGFQKSDLIILAARPSLGKTTLALDFARNIAVRAKVPVGIFSLEMSKEQLVDRLICAEAGVDLWRMRTGRLSDAEGSEDFPKIGHAMGTLSEAPIYIDDSGSANIMEIRTKARRLQSEHGLGMLVVDYLQLMEGRTATDNRVQEVSEITRGLKSLARELDIPVLALSQLSRLVESRTQAIPRLADLRESGSIEQDADVVMFIYRKAMDKNYKREDLPAEERHSAEVHIEKHRNGPTGIVRLFFDEEKVTFKNLDRQYAHNNSAMTAENMPAF